MLRATASAVTSSVASAIADVSLQGWSINHYSQQRSNTVYMRLSHHSLTHYYIIVLVIITLQAMSLVVIFPFYMHDISNHDHFSAEVLITDVFFSGQKLCLILGANIFVFPKVTISFFLH